MHFYSNGYISFLFLDKYVGLFPMLKFRPIRLGECRYIRVGEGVPGFVTFKVNGIGLIGKGFPFIPHQLKESFRSHVLDKELHTGFHSLRPFTVSIKNPDYPLYKGNELVCFQKIQYWIDRKRKRLTSSHVRIS